ncbi:MAG: acyl-CoA thioesterase [Thermomicrobiales bacterium]
MTATTPPWRASRARHVYIAHFRVRNHELDALGHVNNAAYLNYLEQAAIDHAAAGGFSEARLRAIGGVFVARRHEIDYLQPARAGDWLRVITWPVELGAAKAVRAYEITRLPAPLVADPPRDGLRDPGEVGPLPVVIARAQTVWAFVNVATARPRRMPVEIVNEFLREGGPAER